MEIALTFFATVLILSIKQTMLPYPTFSLKLSKSLKLSTSSFVGFEVCFISTG